MSKELRTGEVKEGGRYASAALMESLRRVGLATWPTPRAILWTEENLSIVFDHMEPGERETWMREFKAEIDAGRHAVTAARARLMGQETIGNLRSAPSYGESEADFKARSVEAQRKALAPMQKARSEAQRNRDREAAWRKSGRLMPLGGVPDNWTPQSDQ